MARCSAREAVVRPITRRIILGLVLLLLSGIGFMAIGHSFTPRLVTKLVLVAAIFVLGPVIDNVVEPRFRLLASRPGTSSPGFVRVRTQYLALELLATGLFYAAAIPYFIVEPDAAKAARFVSDDLSALFTAGNSIQTSGS